MRNQAVGKGGGGGARGGRGRRTGFLRGHLGGKGKVKIFYQVLAAVGQHAVILLLRCLQGGLLLLLLLDIGTLGQIGEQGLQVKCRWLSGQAVQIQPIFRGVRGGGRRAHSQVQDAL